MIRSGIHRLVDLLYPLRCAGCGRFDVVLCPECAGRLERTDGPGRCAFCLARWEGTDNCPRCLHMNDLEGVRAAFEMSGTARSLVHALKYRHYRAIAPTMAALMGQIDDGLDIEAFFAVPLHKSRSKERGFNQADLLLRETGWTPVRQGLTRSRRTDQQVGQRLGERRANVAGAFKYEGPRLDGMTVALVDDVITTGATMVECSRVLKDAGAKGVWAFAFARASYQGDEAEPIED